MRSPPAEQQEEPTVVDDVLPRNKALEREDTCVDIERHLKEDARRHDAPSQLRPEGSTYFHALEAMPTVRAIPWREGKDLAPEKGLESARVQVRTGCILAIKGQVIEAKCDHCAQPQSRFTHCIALPNWFRGACAACVMRARGSQCTLRTSAEGARSRLLEMMNAQLSGLEMVANTSKDHGDTSEDSSELVDAEDASLAYQYDNSPPDPDAVNTASYQAFWNRPDGVTEFERKGKSYYIYGGEVYCRVARGKNREGRTLLCHTATRFSCKQRLMSHIKIRHRHEWDLLQDNGLNKPGKKSYAERNAAEKHFGTQLALIRQAAPRPEADSSMRQPRSTHPFHDEVQLFKRQSMQVCGNPVPRPNAVTEDEGSGLFEYVQDEERRQSKRRPAATPPRLASEPGGMHESSASSSQSQTGAKTYRCHVCHKLLGRRDTLNRHIRVSHKGFRRKDYVNRDEGGFQVQESPAQTPTSASRPEAGAAQPKAIADCLETRPSSIDQAPAPLIDTLPRKQQRNIYGIISGLQGGVEHLQKELDSLKKALGIEDEE